MTNNGLVKQDKGAQPTNGRAQGTEIRSAIGTLNDARMPPSSHKPCLTGIKEIPSALVKPAFPIAFQYEYVLDC
jgi:hypothetical protein